LHASRIREQLKARLQREIKLAEERWKLEASEMMKLLEGAGKDIQTVYETEMEALKTLHIRSRDPSPRQGIP
jgi:hypothetical protein